MVDKLPFILWFSEIDIHDLGIAGKYALQMGDMNQRQFPIPNGFILTSHAYFHFVQKNKLIPTITKLLSTIHFDHPESLMQGSQQIRRVIMHAEFPAELLKTLDISYRKLGGLLSHPPVSLHADAVTKELLPVSLAGHEQSFMHIHGEANLILAVRESWASLFAPGAIKFRQDHHISHFDIGSAIVIQKEIVPEQSGVILTADPVTRDKSTIIIEAVYGEPDSIKKALITTDRYEVQKKQLHITKKTIASQEFMLHKEEKITIPLSEANLQKISDNHILDLALLGKKLEQHYYFSQDITWAIQNNTIFILATKPLHLHPVVENNPSHQLSLLLKGVPASPGLKSGSVRILPQVTDTTQIIPGEIVVLQHVDTKHIQKLQKAIAIITEQGGKTTQAAHNFRELGIPAVVGAYNATQLLHTGDIVTVNGTRGEIFKGALTQQNRIQTATKILALLPSVPLIEKVKKDTIDGVLYLPLGKRHVSIKDFEAITRTIQPYPVIYQTTPYQHDIFRTELEAIKTTREIKECNNLWLSIPGIQSRQDLDAMKKTLTAVGMHRSPTFKLLLTIDTPSQTIILEQLIEKGIDGIIVDLHMLTRLLLGHSQPPSDTLPEAVIRTLEHTIKIAHQNNITSGVFGSLQTFHPSVLEALIKSGITYLIEEYTNLEKLRKLVSHIEKEIILKR